MNKNINNLIEKLDNISLKSFFKIVNMCLAVLAILSMILILTGIIVMMYGKFTHKESLFEIWAYITMGSCLTMVAVGLGSMFYDQN